MTKQLTPLRRKDQATGYEKAVKEIVAWLNDQDKSTDVRDAADQIEANFGTTQAG